LKETPIWLYFLRQSNLQYINNIIQIYRALFPFAKIKSPMGNATATVLPLFKNIFSFFLQIKTQFISL
jgi:hypothetical protein